MGRRAEASSGYPGTEPEPALLRYVAARSARVRAWAASTVKMSGESSSWIDLRRSSRSLRALSESGSVRTHLTITDESMTYFMGAGLLPDDRRRAELGIVRAYHDALGRAGIENYPFSQCWTDYRRYSYSGFVMAVMASMLVGQTDRGDEMFMAMANGHAAQIADLDAEEFIG